MNDPLYARSPHMLLYKGSESRIELLGSEWTLGNLRYEEVMTHIDGGETVNTCASKIHIYTMT